MSFDDEETFEHTLLVVREVSVYKIPPRSTSGGYKCGEWLQSDKIWSGRLRLVSVSEVCEIRLEDANTGYLFAACHVHPGKRDIAVEPATDSSRYFVLRIDDGHGKHAFIGLGFAERNEAFDFNVALSDHEKHALRRDKEDVQEDKPDEALSSVDLRLKEGETIRINVKTKTATNAGGMMSQSCGANNVVSSGRMKAPLAPPPGGSRLRSPLPPPPNDAKHLRVVTTVPSTHITGMSAQHHMKLQESIREGTRDSFTDLSQLESSLPTSFNSGSASSNDSHAGWAAF